MFGWSRRSGSRGGEANLSSADNGRLAYFMVVSHHVAIKGRLNHALLFLESGGFLKPKILSAKGAIGFKDAPVDHQGDNRSWLWHFETTAMATRTVAFQCIAKVRHYAPIAALRPPSISYYRRRQFQFLRGQAIAAHGYQAQCQGNC